MPMTTNKIKALSLLFNYQVCLLDFGAQIQKHPDFDYVYVCQENDGTLAWYFSFSIEELLTWPLELFLKQVTAEQDAALGH